MRRHPPRSLAGHSAVGPVPASVHPICGAERSLRRHKLCAICRRGNCPAEMQRSGSLRLKERLNSSSSCQVTSFVKSKSLIEVSFFIHLGARFKGSHPIDREVAFAFADAAPAGELEFLSSRVRLASSLLTHRPLRDSTAARTRVYRATANPPNRAQTHPGPPLISLFRALLDHDGQKAADPSSSPLCKEETTSITFHYARPTVCGFVSKISKSNYGNTDKGCEGFLPEPQGSCWLIFRQPLRENRECDD